MRKLIWTSTLDKFDKLDTEQVHINCLKNILEEQGFANFYWPKKPPKSTQKLFKKGHKKDEQTSKALGLVTGGKEKCLPWYLRYYWDIIIWDIIEKCLLPWYLGKVGCWEEDLLPNSLNKRSEAGKLVRKTTSLTLGGRHITKRMFYTLWKRGRGV